MINKKIFFEKIDNYINKSAGFNDNDILEYQKFITMELDSFIREYKSLLKRNKKFPIIWIVIFYSYLNTILFLKILLKNPLIIKEIISSHDKLKERDFINERDIINYSKKYSIINESQYDTLKQIREKRNNNSVAHILNLDLDHSYIETYSKLSIEIIKNNVEYISFSKNTYLLIKWITNSEFSIGKIDFDSFKKSILESEIDFFLSYIFSNCYKDEIIKNNFLLIVDEIEKDEKEEKIFNSLFKHLFSFWENNTKENIIDEYIKKMIFLDCIFSRNKNHFLNEKTIMLYMNFFKEWSKKEGEIYNFDNVNKVFGSLRIISFILKKNNYKITTNIKDIFKWLLTSNIYNCVATKSLYFVKEIFINSEKQNEWNNFLDDINIKNKKYIYISLEEIYIKEVKNKELVVNE